MACVTRLLGTFVSKVVVDSHFASSICLAFAVAISGLPTVAAADAKPDDYSVTSWSSAPVSQAPSAANQINNQTLRQIVRLSTGGDYVRVRLTGRFGTATVPIGGAAVALHSANDGIVSGSSVPLTFSTRPTGTLSASFGELWSDWVKVRVPAGTELAVDVYFSGNTGTLATGSPLAVQPESRQTTYLAAGNALGANPFPTIAVRDAWFFLDAIDVAAPKAGGTIVALGDQVTTGAAASLNANQRWTDQLARRIASQTLIKPMGVANAGISGNWLGTGGSGPSALARYTRDALKQTRGSHVIVALGLNDIVGGRSATDVIADLRQLILQAHSQGMKVIGATITPAGAVGAVEAERMNVNAWILNSGEFDGVVDFAAAVADAEAPHTLRAVYDSGNGVDLNDSGLAQLGDAVDLNLFKGATP